MQKKRYAQRKHIIGSLDTFLYQLHVLSHFLAPSLFVLLCRVLCEAHCARPRILDPTQSLRFFFGVVLVFNIPAFWVHARYEAVETKAIVLDFVGLAYVPSRLQLLFMDFAIFFLQLILTTISYETYTTQYSPSDNTKDMLSPIPRPSTPADADTRPSSPSSTSDIITATGKIPSTRSDTTVEEDDTYVIDLRLSAVLERLRAPQPEESLLPMPNTTQWASSGTLGMFAMIRARQRARSGDDDAAPGPTSENVGNVPGGMDART